MKFHDDKSDIYPLKGFLTCPTHGTSITAYGARGRLGELHHYYLCTKSKDCGQRHRIEDVHESIEDILSVISVNASVVNLYRKTLEKLFEKDDYQRRDEIARTKSEIEKIKSRLATLQDQFLDSVISPSDYHTMKQKVEKDLTGLELKLKGLKEDKSPFKEYVNQTVPMLENIVEYYRKSDGKTKKKILGCIFSKKLVFEKGRVATNVFNPTIQVLLNTSKVFRKSGTKKRGRK